jgi:two-component system, NarL family, nitrate/nitrite response regulator NarL
MPGIFFGHLWFTLKVNIARLKVAARLVRWARSQSENSYKRNLNLNAALRLRFQEAKMAEVRVAVVHGKQLIREGIAHILRTGGITVVATVESVQSLIKLPSEIKQIDVFILSAMLNGGTLEEAITAIKKGFPDGKVIILSEMTGTGSILTDAYAAGAVAYLTTDTSPAALIEHVRLAALGVRAFPAPPVLEGNAGRLHGRPLFAEDVRLSFSEREQDILRCLASGNSNKCIARDLSITESTVKAHVRSILRKLGAENRTQAAIWATGAIASVMTHIE